MSLWYVTMHMPMAAWHACDRAGACVLRLAWQPDARHGVAHDRVLPGCSRNQPC